MKSSMDHSSEAGYGYIGDFLNAAYLAGFARRRKNPIFNEDFAIQQTNNVAVALPIRLKDNHAKRPGETDATAIIGHVRGKRLENGERIAICEAIQIDVPSIRDMPNESAWNKKVPEGGEIDDFKPFFNPADTENVYNSVFFKNNKPVGRACRNVVRIAGFVEAYSMSRTSQGGVLRDCLLIALRQTRDPEEAIPVRLYGRFSEAFRNEITVGRPIFIEGQFRVRVVKRPIKKEGQTEEGKTEEIRARDAAKADESEFTIERYPYIHCSGIKIADRRMIRSDPEWWNDMKLRFIQEKKARAERALAQIEAKTPPLPVVENEDPEAVIESVITDPDDAPETTIGEL